MSVLRVGIIGTGFGREHLTGFAREEGVKVVALCNQTGRGLDDLAAVYSVPRVFTDYRRLLEVDEIDMVTVATPVDLHKEMVLAALAAGKHVLSEKPLALSAADALEMAQAARDSGLKHMTNFGFRFVPASFQVHDLIRRGFIGEPFHVNIRHMIPSQIDPERPLRWRHMRSRAGMGAMGDLGVHNIDLIRWWLGDFARVVAAQRPLVPYRRREDGSGMAKVDVDDVTMVVGELVSGALASVHVTRCSAGSVIMQAEICGSEGSIRFTRTSLSVAKRGSQDYASFEIEPAFRSVPSSYATFADAVRHDRLPEPSFFDGWAVQRVADAVMRSGDGGGTWQTVADAPRQSVPA